MENKNQTRELDIVSYLANPLLRQAVGSIASKLRCNSDLGKTLAKFYLGLPKSYCPEDGALTAYLESTRKFTSTEVSLAVAKRFQYANVSSDGIDTLMQSFISYYRNTEILKLVDKYNQDRIQDNDAAQIALIDGLNDLPTTSKFFDLVDLSSSNIDDILNEEAVSDSAKIVSKHQVVAESSAFGTYVKGWIVSVNAPPGVGKTMFMLGEICEFIKRGINVVWVALGDMTRSDFLIRCTSIIKKVDFFEVTRNPKAYIDDEVREALSHLRLILEPADTVTATDVSNNLLSIDPSDFDYDVFVLDYDDNLKPEMEMMYEQGGHAYATFTQVSRQKGHFRLGFIASQVKQHLWEEEILPENCSAGSSKKQAVVDMQININRNKDCSSIGTINVAKQRRGILAKSKYQLEVNGGIKDISFQTYQEIYTAVSRGR